MSNNFIRKIMNTSIQIFNYNGSNITMKNEHGNVYVNLTEIAKAFPEKNLSQIVNSQEISEYVEKLAAIYNYIPADILIVKNGGIDFGTWAHQKVALRVCQKLSTDFAIWVDTKIEELLTKGITATPATLDAIIADPDFGIKLLNSLKEERNRRVEAESIVYQQQEVIEIKNSEIKELFPDAQYTRDTLKSVNTFTTTQIAKELGMSAEALNKKLHNLGIQYKVNGQWVLYAKYQDKEYTKTNTYTEVINGVSKTYHSTVWTELGRKFIIKLIKNNQAA